jgi:ABC-type nitrate/sulfonate/bicarbonate transport system permease component
VKVVVVSCVLLVGWRVFRSIARIRPVTDPSMRQVISRFCLIIADGHESMREFLFAKIARRLINALIATWGCVLGVTTICIRVVAMERENPSSLQMKLNTTPIMSTETLIIIDIDGRSR